MACHEPVVLVQMFRVLRAALGLMPLTEEGVTSNFWAANETALERAPQTFTLWVVPQLVARMSGCERPECRWQEQTPASLEALCGMFASGPELVSQRAGPAGQQFFKQAPPP